MRAASILLMVFGVFLIGCGESNKTDNGLEDENPKENSTSTAKEALPQLPELPKGATKGTIGPWGVDVASFEILDSYTGGDVTVNAKGDMRIAVLTLKLEQLRELTDAEVKAVEETGGYLDLARSLGKKGASLPLSSTCFFLGYVERGDEMPNLSFAACSLLTIEEGTSMFVKSVPKGETVPNAFWAVVTAKEVVAKLAFPLKKQTKQPLLLFAPTGKDFTVARINLDNEGTVHSVNFDAKDLLKNVPKEDLPGFEE